jgi:hypothetical protein
LDFKELTDKGEDADLSKAYLWYKEKRGHSVVLPSNSSGFAKASAFVLRTVPS